MDIQKEREAFEAGWVKLGGDFKSFTIVNNMYVLTNNAGDAGVLFKELAERAINSAFALWLIQARRKQCNIELLESEIEALKPQTTPDGFVLVPRDATDEMISHGVNALDRKRTARSCWNAMVEAAENKES